MAGGNTELGNIRVAIDERIETSVVNHVHPHGHTHNYGISSPADKLILGEEMEPTYRSNEDFRMTRWTTTDNTNIGIDRGIRDLSIVGEWMRHCPSTGNWSFSSSAKQEKETMLRRVVRILVYDNDEKVLDEYALVYISGPFVTSLSNNEILLGKAAEINKALEIYNTSREATFDQEETNRQGRNVYLLKTKLSDLIKLVVNIA